MTNTRCSRANQALGRYFGVAKKGVGPSSYEGIREVKKVVESSEHSLQLVGSVKQENASPALLVD